jgi:hypothetical protein
MPGVPASGLECDTFITGQNVTAYAGKANSEIPARRHNGSNLTVFRVNILILPFSRERLRLVDPQRA